MNPDEWRYWEQLIDDRGIVIDRPHAQPHPQYAGMRYPFDYGHIPGTTTADGEEVDAFVGSAPNRARGTDLAHTPGDRNRRSQAAYRRHARRRANDLGVP